MSSNLFSNLIIIIIIIVIISCCTSSKLTLTPTEMQNYNIQLLL